MHFNCGVRSLHTLKNYAVEFVAVSTLHVCTVLKDGGSCELLHVSSVEEPNRTPTVSSPHLKV